jgi:type VI secretion system Hcp family effector
MLEVLDSTLIEVLDSTLIKEDFIMASDTFLQVDGIKGESSDKDHKEWIEILSYNWGVSQMASATASSSGGGSTQRADFQDLSVVKELDSATPLLSKACWGGTHIDKVVLELNRAAGDKREKYMEYIMENVIISYVSVGGGGGGIPTESLTFNYGKITTTYFKQARAGGGVSGSVPAGWNLEENEHI